MGKKVLHILNTSKFSGAENVVVTLIEAFCKMSDDTEFIYVSPDGSIRKVLEEKKITFEPVKAVSVSELRRVIKKYKPDIIHAHDFTASIIAALAAGKISVISHLHNNGPWLKKYCIKSFAYGISCIKYRHILSVSDSIFSEYVFGRFIKGKGAVIGNPINTLKVAGLAERAEESETFDVCFLGRLCEAKDPVRFVEIVRKLSESIPVKTVIIGDGPYRQKVEEKILEYGLGESIVLKGFLSNPYGILKKSKALCAPSKWEGFGLMAVEALSLGVPVAASPVGGLVDIVTDRCGKFCQTDSEFVDFLESVLKDEETFKTYSQAAKDRAKELDNMDDYYNKIKSFYS
ncbi:MAG: glycosyltransferase [Clostridia bacterium]|nr:glycosyltransferase [Clostridia bacterium]